MTVMNGADDRPLLVLSRVDKGRVGLLLTDQMWLWARGYEGGGPHLDLLRRLAHWLMKEPELEEEALRASAKGREVTVERQSVSGEARDTNLVAPDGAKTKLELDAYAPGLSRAHLTSASSVSIAPRTASMSRWSTSARRIRSKCGTSSRPRKSCARSPRRPAERRVACGRRRRCGRHATRCRLQPVVELRRRRLHRRQADRLDRIDRRAFDFARFRVLRPRACCSA